MARGGRAMVTGRRLRRLTTAVRPPVRSVLYVGHSQRPTGLHTGGHAQWPYPPSRRLGGAAGRGVEPVPSARRPGAGGHLRYLPWVIPTVVNGVKCVVVDRALREYDERAWDFVLDFARDNDLLVTEACLLPDEAALPAESAAQVRVRHSSRVCRSAQAVIAQGIVLVRA